MTNPFGCCLGANKWSFISFAVYFTDQNYFQVQILSNFFCLLALIIHGLGLLKEAKEIENLNLNLIFDL